MDKTTKEYAQSLANKEWGNVIKAGELGFADGYLRAIEECKVKELMKENERLTNLSADYQHQLTALIETLENNDFRFLAETVEMTMKIAKKNNP